MTRRAFPRGGVRTRLPVTIYRRASDEFSPTEIEGLALWLDAADASSTYTTDAGPVTAVSSPLDIAGCALWLDASDATSITESGGLVSQWSDKSGNNRHATASSTARPTTGTRTVGGKNAMDFNGTANSMATGGSAFPTAATHTVFLVYQLDSASQSRTSALLTAATIGDQEIRVAGFGSTAVQYVFNNNLGTTMASTAIGLGPIVFSAREATASMRSAGAGVLSTTSGSAFAWSSGSMLIGSRTAGNFVDGLLCEIIIYPTTLTDSQTASVEAYLATKWGISGVHVPATASSDPVGYWRDKSGNNRHAVQATAGKRGAVGTQNGRRAITLDGTDDHFVLGDLSAAFPTAAEIIASYGITSTDTGYVIYQTANNITSDLFGATSFSGAFKTTRLNGASLALPTTAGAYLWGVASSSSSHELFAQGAKVLSSAADYSAGTNHAIGTRTADGTATTSLAGRMNEVCVFNRVLTISERQRVNRYLAAKWGITLAPQVSNADAQDWINRVYANGGTVSAATATAVNTLCDSLDASGVRPLMYRMGIFCGSNLNAALVPLYRGPSLGGTQYGNATDTNNAFVGVGTDYAETGASGGLTGNGTSKYLDTGFPMNTLPSTTSGHAAVYCPNRSSRVSFAGMIGVNTLAASGFGISTDASVYGIWGQLAFAANTANGLLIASRTSDSSQQTYVNATSIATNNTPTTPAASSLNAPVFANRASASVVDNYDSRRYCGYSIGLGLTAAQVSAYYTAMQAFQTALTRNV